MSNLVIVAIPARDEKVWKVSSEKVPHMTLLFLGENPEDVPKLGRITQFVQHAAETSEHGPFMASVDERGTLGDDEADVLFFRKGYDLRWITEFRNQLLQQNDIRAAYETADQHPEWLPHLTLGYPETPAYDGEIPEHGLNWITFDRIAVWTGDFEGPEFKLTWPERELEGGPMAMSTMNDELKAQGPEALLEHFGVKGMRWGVRQAKDTQVTVGGKSKMVTAKKAAKLDAQWEKNQYTLPKAIERHNAMADHFNSRIGALNDQHKDLHISDEQWDNPSTRTPQQKEYMKKVDNLTREGYERAIAKELPSPTGRKKTTIEMRGDQMSVVIKDVHAKHAAVEDGDEVFLFRVTRNADGRITKIEPVEDSMSQAADRGAEFVEHFGVKGMKWGVRNRIPENKNAELVRRGMGPSTKLRDRTVITGSDKRFARRAKKADTYLALHDRTVKANKENRKAIDNKPEYKDAKFGLRGKDRGTPLHKKYLDEHYAAYAKTFNEQANKVFNETGTKQYAFREVQNGGKFGTKREIYVRDVKHASDDVESMIVELLLDADGKVTGYKMHKPEASLEQMAEVGEEFLSHFGVKGMKWGVRKAASSVKTGAKKVGRGLSRLGAALADSYWQGSTYNDAKHEDVHNHVAQVLDNHIERLQRAPKYRGKNLKADSDLRKEYYQDVAKVTDSAYRRGVKEVYGENFTGTKSAHYVNDARGPRIEVRDKLRGEVTSESPLTSMRDIRKKREAALAQAATTDFPDLEIELTLDDNGQISGIGFVKPSDGELAQAALFDIGADFIEHFGIKGMKWGVRNRKGEPVAVTPTATSKVPAGTKRKTKIKVEGGENHPAHEDAVKVAQAHAKLKKSGPAALSNQELREVANRLQLENQVALLTSNKGKQFVARQLSNEGQNIARVGVREGVKKGARKVGVSALG